MNIFIKAKTFLMIDQVPACHFMREGWVSWKTSFINRENVKKKKKKKSLRCNLLFCKHMSNVIDKHMNSLLMRNAKIILSSSHPPRILCPKSGFNLD